MGLTGLTGLKGLMGLRELDKGRGGEGEMGTRGIYCVKIKEQKAEGKVKWGKSSLLAF